MYKVKPFLLFDLNDGALLQNNEVTIHLKKQSMIKFLRELQEDRTIINSQLSIGEHFPNNAEHAVQFLLTNKVIFEEIKPTFNFTDIIVYSNSQMFIEIFEFLAKGSLENVRFDSFEDGKFDFRDFHEDSLVILFFNPLELRIYEKTVETIRKIGCAVKVIFYYNHSIYMSNFHKKKWYNPCPKCFFYVIEAQLRGASKSHGSVNFQTLIDILYLHETNFKIECILNPLRLLGVMNELLNQITSPNNINSFVNIVHEFSLESSYENSDYSYHFEMCDCYE
ncbi:MAG: McbB family protein [Oscillospiraceae bacterium]|nr:McbB family protein [Oscillospiraceae bacterium]